MAIVIESLEAAHEDGQWIVHATVDGKSTSARVAVNEDASCVSIEQGFFFLLSERGLKEVGNSAAYHASLGKLLQQAVAKKSVGVPLELGRVTYRGRRRWWQFKGPAEPGAAADRGNG